MSVISYILELDVFNGHETSREFAAGAIRELRRYAEYRDVAARHVGGACEKVIEFRGNTPEYWWAEFHIRPDGRVWAYGYAP